jgi:chaperonin GroEL
MKAGIKSLLLIGDSFSDEVINFLIANKNADKFQAIAVKVPGLAADEKMAALQDIAILTGGIPLYKGAGDSLKALAPQHLGHARRAWVDRTMFGIVSGRRNARALREHIKALRIQLENTSDQKVQESLEVRLGKLLGGVATLLVGGDSEFEIERRKDAAKSASKAVRRAIQGGVVPGGGVALMDCQKVLGDCLKNAQDSDERAAYRILQDALEAPLRTLCANAGYDEATVARVRLAGAGQGVNLKTGEIETLVERGILDVAPVLQAVLRYAVSSAAQALTVDVLVHNKNPQTRTDP